MQVLDNLKFALIHCTALARAPGPPADLLKLDVDNRPSKTSSTTLSNFVKNKKKKNLFYLKQKCYKNMFSQMTGDMWHVLGRSLGYSNRNIHNIAENSGYLVLALITRDVVGKTKILYFRMHASPQLDNEKFSDQSVLLKFSVNLFIYQARLSLAW